MEKKRNDWIEPSRVSIISVARSEPLPRKKLKGSTGFWEQRMGVGKEKEEYTEKVLGTVQQKT